MRAVVIHSFGGPEVLEVTDVRRAHEDLPARRSTGNLVLDPRS